MAKRHIRTAAVCFTVFLMAAAALVLCGTVTAKAEESAQAYILHEDRGTRGFWYTGEKGTKDLARNRIYGRSGLVWPYHYAWADGQPFKDVAMINDFTEQSQVNYVEYPEWVEGITGDVRSTNDAPHGYWNNSQLPVEEVAALAERTPYITKRLLPIDPAVTDIAHTACQFTREDVNYTVRVKDDGWHRISLYIGSPYQSEIDYKSTRLSLYDLNGALLTSDEITDVNKGVWVGYAVRGSVRIQVDCGAYSGAAVNMIAFDEYQEDPSAAVADFTASRRGVKTIDLSWRSEADTVKIYRRTKGSRIWNILARVDGADSYTDEATEIASEYEYMLTGGTKRSYTAADNRYDWANCVPDAADCNIPIESRAVSAATARYAQTKMEFDKPVYETEYGEPIEVALSVLRFEGGAFVPYPGAEVTLELGGDNAFSTINGADLPNMPTRIGTRTAGPDGTVRFTYTSDCPGEYALIASVPALADENDPEKGFAPCAAQAVFVQAERVERNAPALYTVSDAIKPGDTVTVTGNFLTPNDDLTVAYAPATGKPPAAFDETAAPDGVKYIRYDELLVTDSAYETGIMFVFPQSERAGVYDLWVKNSVGWSRGVTMNAARPLYMSQDGGYEGILIEVVGRNFFVSDFGLGDEEISKSLVKVKLKRVGNTEGVDDGVTEVKELGIVNGVRYTAENSASGRDVEWSNPYKITFAVPAVENYGTYEVHVAADGYNYRPLKAPQRLTIVERKAQAWNETVFGPLAENAHTGNDPLDLGLFWAQDLNYGNVATMTPNAAPGAALANDLSVKTLTAAVNAASDSLSAQGGGVIYFPAGDYYLAGVTLRENTMIVGAGAGRTTLYYVGNGGSVWIRGRNVSNVGMARVACEKYEGSPANPDYIISLEEDIINGSVNYDVSNRVTVHKFVTDCTFRFGSEVRKDGVNTRALIAMTALKYVIMQNCAYDGGNSVLNANYHNEYGILRNVRARADSESSATPSLTSLYTLIENVHMTLSYAGHGFSVKSDAYISNCYITKAGTAGDRLNIGEMILVEPPGGYFATGKILKATERTFTVNVESGNRIDANTRKNNSKFGVFINGGKGTGQLRYFKKVPLADGYGNSYELMDDERSFDVIPDSTSEFTIILPMGGVTIYRFKGNDNKKAIFLYSNVFDSVVAECDLTDTEGIAVFATDIADAGRFCPNIGVRIEKNTVRGVSPQTGKGGITARSQRNPALESARVQMMNISIRNNTVIGAKGDYADYIPNGSEATDKRGIAIDTMLTAGQSTSGDVRFVTIEGNRVEDCAYGIYADNRITGIIVRNNTIENVEADERVTYFAPDQLHIFAAHTLYVDGEISGLSGEYRFGAALPAPAGDNGAHFLGWSATPEYTSDEAITTRALAANATLYALFGCKITFDYGYDRAAGRTFNEIVVSSGRSAKDKAEAFGDPFRVGYAFGGWYLDEECAQPFDLSAGAEKSLTVYAKWLDKKGAVQSAAPEKNNALPWILAGSIGGALAAGGAALIVLKRKRLKK